MSSPIEVSLEDINTFRSKISKIKSLTKYETRTDDAYLTRFLKVAKNDQKKALKRYETFYTTILTFPFAKAIADRAESEYHDLVESIAEMEEVKTVDGTQAPPILAYYGTDKTERHLLVYDIAKVNAFTEIPNFLEASMYQALIMLDQVMEQHPESIDNGFVSVEDDSGLNLEMVKLFMSNIAFSTKFVKLMDGTLPMKFNKAFMMNVPKVFWILWKCIKPFLSQKMIDRCHIVDGTEEVVADLGGLAFTPSQFGGQRDFVNVRYNVEEALYKIFPKTRE